jgi:hypothetical protein
MPLAAKGLAALEIAAATRGAEGVAAMVKGQVSARLDEYGAPMVRFSCVVDL